MFPFPESVTSDLNKHKDFFRTGKMCRLCVSIKMVLHETGNIFGVILTNSFRFAGFQKRLKVRSEIVLLLMFK